MQRLASQAAKTAQLFVCITCCLSQMAGVRPKGAMHITTAYKQELPQHRCVQHRGGGCSDAQCCSTHTRCRMRLTEATAADDAEL
jgi:hypothetical protein